MLFNITTALPSWADVKSVSSWGGLVLRAMACQMGFELPLVNWTSGAIYWPAPCGSEPLASSSPPSPPEPQLWFRVWHHGELTGRYCYGSLPPGYGGEPNSNGDGRLIEGTTLPSISRLTEATTFLFSFVPPNWISPPGLASQTIITLLLVLLVGAAISAVIVNLFARYDRLRKTIQAVAEKHKQCDAREHKLQLQERQLATQRQEQTDTVTRLASQRTAELTDSINNLVQLLKDSTKREFNLSKDKTTSETQLAAARQNLASTRAELAETQASRMSLRDQVGVLKNECHHLTILAENNSELAEARQEAARCQEQMKLAHVSQTVLKRDLELGKEERQKLSQKLVKVYEERSAFRERTAIAEKRSKESRQEVENLSEVRRELMLNVATIRKELGSTQQELSAFQENWNKTASVRRAKDRRVKRLTQRHEEDRKKLKQMKSTIEATSNREMVTAAINLEVESELADLKLKVEADNAQARRDSVAEAASRAALSTAQEECDALKAQLGQTQQELEIAREKALSATQLETDLRKSKRSLTRTKKEKNSAEENAAKVAHDVDQVQEELRKAQSQLQESEQALRQAVEAKTVVESALATSEKSLVEARQATGVAEAELQRIKTQQGENTRDDETKLMIAQHQQELAASDGAIQKSWDELMAVGGGFGLIDQAIKSDPQHQQDQLMSYYDPGATVEDGFDEIMANFNPDGPFDDLDAALMGMDPMIDVFGLGEGEDAKEDFWGDLERAAGLSDDTRAVQQQGKGDSNIDPVLLSLGESAPMDSVIVTGSPAAEVETRPGGFSFNSTLSDEDRRCIPKAPETFIVPVPPAPVQLPVKSLKLARMWRCYRWRRYKQVTKTMRLGVPVQKKWKKVVRVSK